MKHKLHAHKNAVANYETGLENGVDFLNLSVVKQLDLFHFLANVFRFGNSMTYTKVIFFYIILQLKTAFHISNRTSLCLNLIMCFCLLFVHTFHKHRFPITTSNLLYFAACFEPLQKKNPKMLDFFQLCSGKFPGKKACYHFLNFKRSVSGLIQIKQASIKWHQLPLKCH